MSVALPPGLQAGSREVETFLEVVGCELLIVQELVPAEEYGFLLEEHLVVLEGYGLVLVDVEEVEDLLEVAGVEIDDLAGDGLP